jgi:hypothetical protein
MDTYEPQMFYERFSANESRSQYALIQRVGLLRAAPVTILTQHWNSEPAVSNIKSVG